MPAPYTSEMAPSPNPDSPQVGILVFEDDPYSGTALRQMLDSEGWRVRVAQDLKMLQTELKTGENSLLIANIAMVGIDGLLFHVLRELATVSVADGARLRVLFVVPEMTGGQFVQVIEEARLPYVLRPFHLHDFLEKVSDLLG